MTYEIIFWGNSSHIDNVFRLQKIIIRITMGATTRDSCREHFKSFKILPLHLYFSPVCSQQQKCSYGKFSTA